MANSERDNPRDIQSTDKRKTESGENGEVTEESRDFPFVPAPILLCRANSLV